MKIMTQHILAINNYLRSPIEGLLQFSKRWSENYQRKQQIKRTIRELSQLTDNELKDIGLGRGDIYSVASGDNSLKRSAADTNANLRGWV